MKKSSLAALFFVVAEALGAQGWFRLPNNELGYAHDIMTRGVFRCGDPVYLWTGGSCTLGQNALTLRSANGALHLSFEGISARVVGSNQQSDPLTLGRMRVRVDGDFSNVGSSAVNAPVFFFNLFIDKTAPITSSSFAGFGFTSRTPGAFPFDCCEGTPTYASFRVTTPPDGYRYTGVLYDNFTFPGFDFMDGEFEVTARVGIVPEPSSVALMATGMLLLGGVAARKRRPSAR